MIKRRVMNLPTLERKAGNVEILDLSKSVWLAPKKALSISSTDLADCKQLIFRSLECLKESKPSIVYDRKKSATYLKLIKSDSKSNKDFLSSLVGMRACMILQSYINQVDNGTSILSRLLSPVYDEVNGQRVIVALVDKGWIGVSGVSKILQAIVTELNSISCTIINSFNYADVQTLKTAIAIVKNCCAKISTSKLDASVYIDPVVYSFACLCDYLNLLFSFADACTVQPQTGLPDMKECNFINCRNIECPEFITTSDNTPFLVDFWRTEYASKTFEGMLKNSLIKFDDFCSIDEESHSWSFKEDFEINVLNSLFDTIMDASLNLEWNLRLIDSKFNLLKDYCLEKIQLAVLEDKEISEDLRIGFAVLNPVPIQRVSAPIVTPALTLEQLRDSSFLNDPELDDLFSRFVAFIKRWFEPVHNPSFAGFEIDLSFDSSVEKIIRIRSRGPQLDDDYRLASSEVSFVTKNGKPSQSIHDYQTIGCVPERVTWTREVRNLVKFKELSKKGESSVVGTYGCVLSIQNYPSFLTELRASALKCDLCVNTDLQQFTLTPSADLYTILPPQEGPQQVPIFGGLDGNKSFRTCAGTNFSTSPFDWTVSDPGSSFEDAFFAFPAHMVLSATQDVLKKLYESRIISATSDIGHIPNRIFPKCEQVTIAQKELGLLLDSVDPSLISICGKLMISGISSRKKVGGAVGWKKSVYLPANLSTKDLVADENVLSRYVDLPAISTYVIPLPSDVLTPQARLLLDQAKVIECGRGRYGNQLCTILPSNGFAIQQSAKSGQHDFNLTWKNAAGASCWISVNDCETVLDCVKSMNPDDVLFIFQLSWEDIATGLAEKLRSVKLPRISNGHVDESGKLSCWIDYGSATINSYVRKRKLVFLKSGQVMSRDKTIFINNDFLSDYDASELSIKFMLRKLRDITLALYSHFQMPNSLIGNRERDFKWLCENYSPIVDIVISALKADYATDMPLAYFMPGSAGTVADLSEAADAIQSCVKSLEGGLDVINKFSTLESALLQLTANNQEILEFSTKTSVVKTDSMAVKVVKILLKYLYSLCGSRYLIEGVTLHTIGVFTPLKYITKELFEQIRSGRLDAFSAPTLSSGCRFDFLSSIVESSFSTLLASKVSSDLNDLGDARIE